MTAALANEGSPSVVPPTGERRTPSGNPHIDKLRELIAAGEAAFPAGFPEIRATSCVNPELGPENLVHGPELPWHAKSPPDYPEGIEFDFSVPLDCAAFWMQAQPDHFDRAPRCFQLAASRDGSVWEPILTVPDAAWTDPTGWQSWNIERPGPWRVFRLAIVSNAGDPQFLTVRRVWFEPRLGDQEVRSRRGAFSGAAVGSGSGRFARSGFEEYEILVLQMGKVASNTIRKTINQYAGRPVSRHLHHLSPGRLESQVGAMDVSTPADWRRSMLGQFIEGIKTLDYIRGDAHRRWKIITLCRDPMAQVVSSFFQQMPYLYPSLFDRYRDGSETIDASIDFFTRHVDRLISGRPPQNAFLSKVLRHITESPLRWFQEEIEDTLGYPIFAQVFDRSRGYSVYSHGRADFLVIRYEQLAEVLPQSLTDFLGFPIDKIVSANVTGDKPVHAMYREFVNAAKFDAPILDHYYNSDYARFFYTDAEIARARRRWAR